MAKRTKSDSELLGLENAPTPDFTPPEMTPARRVEIHRAAQAHADANPSDPFAKARARLYMTRGLELPSDVLAAAESQITARRAAKAGGL